MKYSRAFGQRINIADRLFTKRLNEKIQHTGLTASRWAAVSCLMFDGELTQAAICERLSMEASSISKTLDLMEKKGWIKRNVSDDKREKLITLTDKAKKHLPSWSQAVIDVQNQAYQGISKEDIDIFYSVIDKILSNLKTEQ